MSGLQCLSRDNGNPTIILPINREGMLPPDFQKPFWQDVQSGHVQKIARTVPGGVN
jgi:hypothetical protein